MIKCIIQVIVVIARVCINQNEIKRPKNLQRYKTIIVMIG